MKKIVKKIISLSMCICMMMAFTVGASAAGSYESGIHSYYSHLPANSARGLCLNVYGNETINSGRNVNVYAYENVKAQRWIHKHDSNYYSNLYSELVDRWGNEYRLEIYTVNNNADVYISTEYDDDARLMLEWFEEPYVGDYYIIRTANYGGKYLHVDSQNNAIFSNSNYTYWYDGYH